MEEAIGADELLKDANCLYQKIKKGKHTRLKRGNAVLETGKYRVEQQQCLRNIGAIHITIGGLM
jgi:hypothetical protein